MKSLRLLPALFVLAGPLVAGDLAPDRQARLDTRIERIKAWAASPLVVQAVAAQNAATPAAYLAMTQEKWKGLPADDAFVLGFSTNTPGLWLTAERTDWVSEAFLSDAHGRKVAFIAKPTHWIHAGTPKHDQPMQGKVWQGSPEVDESTGLTQIQVSVPVLSAEQKPIGSLVVGIPVAKLD